MPSDERALGALLEESHDLHADAMRETRGALCDVVDEGQQVRAHGGIDPEQTRQFHQQRSRGLTAAGAVAGIGAGATILSVMGARAAFSDVPADIAAAQTAASIEHLALAVYAKAATLPPLVAKNLGPERATLIAFLTMTVKQHNDHLAAFNSAASRLGGKPQTAPDSVVYNSVVVPKLPSLTTLKAIVDFAAELELVAAETYAVQTYSVADTQLRSAFASIMGVESQHRSILLAVSALLGAGAPDLIKLGGVVEQLPAAAGSVGFPDSFLPLDMARPATEGAVK